MIYSLQTLSRSSSVSSAITKSRPSAAWEIPHHLSQLLPKFSPEYVATHGAAVERAFAGPPALHRFPAQTARWVVGAGRRVIDEYGSDAASIWSDNPTAELLQRRLREFDGISQKKAAMAVEILERQMGIAVADLHGSDIAYDVHVRRVFLRSGLAERDDPEHMLAEARRLYPERPGALDNPAWGHRPPLVPTHPAAMRLLRHRHGLAPNSYHRAMPSEAPDSIRQSGGPSIGVSTGSCQWKIAFCGSRDRSQHGEHRRLRTACQRDALMGHCSTKLDQRVRGQRRSTIERCAEFDPCDFVMNGQSGNAKGNPGKSKCVLDGISENTHSSPTAKVPKNAKKP